MAPTVMLDGLRSTIVLLAAAAGFAFFMYRPHAKAEAMLAAEAQAIRALREAVQIKPNATVQERGVYRYRWVLDGPLPPLLVAEPVEPGESAVRSFAIMAGSVIYVRDPVISDALPGRITEADLRYYLALQPEDREKATRPSAWMPLAEPAEESCHNISLCEHEAGNHPTATARQRQGQAMVVG